MSDKAGANNVGVLAIREIPSGRIFFDVDGHDHLLTYSEAFAALHQPRSGYDDPAGATLATKRLDGNAEFPVDAFVSVDRRSYSVQPRRGVA